MAQITLKFVYFIFSIVLVSTVFGWFSYIGIGEEFNLTESGGLNFYFYKDKE